VTRGGAVWNLPFREWRNSAFGERVAQTGRPVGICLTPTGYFAAAAPAAKR
jgi:hypothetical protein